MLKKTNICFLLCILPSLLFAQRPRWIFHYPSSNDKNYYYRVTSAEADCYEKAYSKAFSVAIYESAWKLGVSVEKANDVDAIEKTVVKDLKFYPTNLKLPMNKVCEYVEPLTGSHKIRIYILWQVARYGNVSPDFEDFTECQ